MDAQTGTDVRVADRRTQPRRLHRADGGRGPGNTAGKTLTVNLTDLPDGRTEVALTDGEWASDDPHLAYCNTYWGGVLQRLKSHVEKS